MNELFSEIPDSAQDVLKDMMETFNSWSKGDIDYKSELFKPPEWKGYRFPPLFSAEAAKRYFEEVEIKENTVFVFSYPKTGTNWIAEVIRQILYGGDEELNALSKKIPALLTAIEIWKPTKFELIKHLAIPHNVFTSHLPAELVDFEKIKKAKGKIVIPIRNPKDQAVSWFHFTQNQFFDIVRDEMSSEWSEFFQDYIQGKHRTFSKLGEWYPEFLLGWYRYKDDDNVMFVHFEDMKKDPKSSIRKIAEFLNIKLSDDQVSVIAQLTSFDYMKKTQENPENEMAELHSRMNVMRKGQAGAWKDTFTVTQSEMMDEVIAEKLGSIDIDFRYE